MIRPEIPESTPSSMWQAGSRTTVVIGCLAVIFAIFYPALQFERPRRRHPCKINLKQIGLALHNYHDTYKSFPPAFVLGPDGKPWHSWRVLILPFLEEEPLWKRYRFDEPWNGPNNSKLLKDRPAVFACRSFDDEPWIPKTDTTYVAVVGNETVWPGSSAIQHADVTDGTSNTVFVVEVRDAGIPWLSPRDLSIDEASIPPTDRPGFHPSSIHTGGGHVLMGDGTVRFVNFDIAPEIWKALLTREGGETINHF